MRRLSYCFILLGFLFLFACATDSGVEENTAATMNSTSSQPQYPAYGAGTATNPQNNTSLMNSNMKQNNTSLMNSNMNMMQQQNMQQQMMQQMQQNMMNSPGMGMGGGGFGGNRTMGGGTMGGGTMGGGIPR